MPFIIPTNNVVLYSGVRITDGEQIAFSTSTSQNQYFAAHKETEFLDCTYIKKTGHVRLEVPTRTVMNCNYMSFTNNSFENKTIYARIVDWRYVNNVTTDVLYDIDWFQTKMFEIDFEPSLVEREHLSEHDWEVANDEPYTQDIPALMTEEPLPMASTMERRYSQDDGDLWKVGYDQRHYTIMMYIAGWEYDVSSQDIQNNVDAIIKKTGLVSHVREQSEYSSVLEENSRISIQIPNAYEIFLFDWEVTNSVVGFSNILDILTRQGATHSIIGIYYVPTQAVINWLGGNVFTGNDDNDGLPWVHIGPNMGVYNNKLMRSPYQYVRVYNCKGDVKEYYYEYFFNGADFYLALTADPMPMLSLFPYDYKMTTDPEDTTADKLHCNVDERMDYGYLPQVGYCTDAYLSYISNQYMQQCATRTVYDDMCWDLNQSLNKAGELAGAATMLAGAATADVSMAWAGAQTFSSSSIASLNAQYDKDTRDALEEARAGTSKKFHPSMVFGNAKKAFVSNEYHAGVTTNNIDRYLGFISDSTIGAFIVVNVSAPDSILKLYDDYFSTYGYATNQVKIPNIINFINGNDPDAKVHFDRQMPGYETGRTYCKTSNAHVITDGGSVINNYIEKLFDNGCFFLNGDDLS